MHACAKGVNSVFQARSGDPALTRAGSHAFTLLRKGSGAANPDTRY